MKFKQFLIEVGTFAGAPSGPGFTSGDKPAGGDIATYSRKLFSGPVRRQYPNMVGSSNSYEDTFRTKKKKK